MVHVVMGAEKSYAVYAPLSYHHVKIPLSLVGSTGCCARCHEATNWLRVQSDFAHNNSHPFSSKVIVRVSGASGESLKQRTE